MPLFIIFILIFPSIFSLIPFCCTIGSTGNTIPCPFALLLIYMIYCKYLGLRSYILVLMASWEFSIEGLVWKGFYRGLDEKLVT